MAIVINTSTVIVVCSSMTITIRQVQKRTADRRDRRVRVRKKRQVMWCGLVVNAMG